MGLGTGTWDRDRLSVGPGLGTGYLSGSRERVGIDDRQFSRALRLAPYYRVGGNSAGVVIFRVWWDRDRLSVGPGLGTGYLSGSRERVGIDDRQFSRALRLAPYYRVGGNSAGVVIFRVSRKPDNPVRPGSTGGRAVWTIIVAAATIIVRDSAGIAGTAEGFDRGNGRQE